MVRSIARCPECSNTVAINIESDEVATLQPASMTQDGSTHELVVKKRVLPLPEELQKELDETQEFTV